MRLSSKSVLACLVCICLLPVLGCGERVSDLFTAVQEGKLSLAESILVRRPEEVGARCLGRTALHLAVVRDDYEMAGLLLRKGADINAKDAGANTPLHVASLCFRYRLAALLLREGADASAHNQFGQTPLHYAACMGQKSIAGLLLKAGAQKDVRDLDGNTPVDLARAMGMTGLVSLLEAKGGS